MKAGDILGHEFMGEVVEVGHAAMSNLEGRRPRRRAVHHRLRQLLLLQAAALVGLRQLEPERADGRGSSTATPAPGLFGYSHMMGGYAGGQAQYVRVPFADVGPIKVPDALADEQVLFLTDIFPTGYMAAENCNIQPGDTVAVWGCGPGRAVRDRERVAARRRAGHRHRLRAGAAADGGAARRRRDDQLRGGRRLRSAEAADRRAAGPTPASTPSGSRRTARRSTPTTIASKAAALPGDRSPDRAAPGDSRLPQGRHRVDPRRLRRLPRQDPVRRRVRQGADLQDGPDPRQKYLKPLLERIESGEIDPSFVITHRLPLDEAAEAYKTFRDNKDECIKVVLKPN